MLKTTLAAIRAHGPCEEGWMKLKAALGEEWADDVEIPLARIVETNGQDDAIWALRACGPEGERVARLFACDCAERALALIPAPDPRSVEAIAVSRRFANGDATCEELSAAGCAAWAAAGAAARAAARDAARAAARAAARDAAGDAARDAAWAAARAAARDAAGDAAGVAAKAAARAAAGATARDAAGAAARDAEEAWQRERLLQYVNGDI